MKFDKLISATALLAMTVVASGELPALNVKPWYGHFVGYETKALKTGIKTDGSMILEVKNSKGDPMGFKKGLIFTPDIIETVNGKQVVKTIDPTSLTTNDKATDDPEKVTYRGKVTGGAEFEMVVEFDRNTMIMGGRLIDKGTLTNPLQFQVRCRYQTPYSYTPDDKREDETEDDEISYMRSDKKRGKCGVFESVDFSDEKTFGAMTAVQVEMKAYDKRFIYQLQGPGSLSLANPRGTQSAPMDGFFVSWIADSEKDTKGEGRMIFEIK